MKKKPLALSTVIATVAMAGGALPNIAFAQTFSLEEVVVTARKKEETLQDVPVSVSNFSADDLAALNLTDTTDLATFSPSVYIEPAPANNGTAAKTTIRGQVQSDNLITTDTSVGWYYDDVYLARAYGTINSLFDAERVEILKGPQGTLYGRNTTGGAIKLVSRKADPLDVLNGYVTGGIGNFGAQKIGGAVNLPVIEDVLAVRLTALQDDVKDGYGSLTIVPTGVPVMPSFAPYKEDTGVKDAEMFRIGATWYASEDLKVLASYEESELYVTNLMYNINNNDGDLYEDGATNMLHESWADAKTAALTLTYDINEELSTKLVYGWREVVSSFYSDVDGTVIPANYFVEPFVQEAEQHSLEWQLNGFAVDGALEWITGLYWFTEKGIDNSLSGGGSGYGSFNATVDNNESMSAFISTTLHLTESVNFTGGVRYTKDSKPVTIEAKHYNVFGAFDGCRFDDPNTPGANFDTCTWGDSTDYEFISWQVGLDWFVTDDVLSYIKSSRASRSGGQNLRGLGETEFPVGSGTFVNTNASFEPETATDIELGMKGQFLDNTLQLNAAYYHVFYDEIQQSQLLRGVGPFGDTITFINNAAGADFDGIEIEAKWVITDELMVTGTAGKIDWRFDNTEEYARAVPEDELTLRVNYLIPASYGTWNLDLNYTYRGEYLTNSSATRSQSEGIYADDAVVESVDLFGARATLDLEDYGLTLALWGKNLTDEEYTTMPLAPAYATIPSLGTNLVAHSVAAPRSYGVEATYRF